MNDQLDGNDIRCAFQRCRDGYRYDTYHRCANEGVAKEDFDVNRIASDQAVGHAPPLVRFGIQR